MDKLYFDVLKSVLDLLEDLNKEVAPYLESINFKIINQKESAFWKYYDIIRYYKGQNSVNKFVLSQINEYYKDFIIFWDVTYYKYNKAQDLYADVNYLRYKYFEYRNGVHQNNKSVLHYIFFFQFIDFLLTRWRLVLEPHKIVEIGYTLFWRFLDKLQKTEFLTKFRPIYYYSSILNIDLTNNIGISKHFTDYPYSVRFLVYKLNKILKDSWELTHWWMISIIKRELNNKENKIWSKFRDGWKEHDSLIHNIMNVIADNSNISEDDKKALWVMKETWDIEDEDGPSYIEDATWYDPYAKLMEVIQNLITSAILVTTKEDLNLKNQKIWLFIYRLFQDINLDKMLLVNKKFWAYDHNTFLWMVNIIKSKQWKWMKKNKHVNTNVIEINNSILKL